MKNIEILNEHGRKVLFYDSETDELNVFLSPIKDIPSIEYLKDLNELLHIKDNKDILSLLKDFCETYNLKYIENETSN